MAPSAPATLARVAGQGGQPGQGGRGAVAHRHLDDSASHKNRHRIEDGRGGRLLILLGHDHDPQRLDTSAASSEFGSIFGCHRHGWLLLLQLLHHDIRPSTP
jgi:hypothetical protein